MKKLFLLMLTASMLVTLVACGTKYEDTNGDSVFTLQTITDKNIIELDVGSSGLSYSEESVGDVVFSSKYSSSDFNGVAELYQTNFITSSDVSVYIGSVNVRDGNFKLVAVNDDEIIHEFALDTFNETLIFEDLTGSFSIRVAGESASFEFDISVD